MSPSFQDENLSQPTPHSDPVFTSFTSSLDLLRESRLPSKITLKGTLRYLDPDIKDKLYKVFDDTVSSVSKFTDAKITWKVPYSSPGLINNKEYMKKWKANESRKDLYEVLSGYSKRPEIVRFNKIF